MVAITALNGRIPTVMLASVPGGQRLRMDAAASLARLSAAMDAAGHGPLLLSPGRSGYRTLADQRYMISIGLTTMPSGQSQHGEGLAADLADLGGYDGERYRWLAEHGPAHGWTQPAWARRGGSLPEPWHWEYDARTDQHPTAQEDDDMTPEQAKLLGEIHWMLSQVRGTDLPPIATHAKAAHAAGDLANAGIANVTNGVTALLGRAPGTMDAAAIVDLLDDDLARAVADEIDRRARARLA